MVARKDSTKSKEGNKVYMKKIMLVFGTRPEAIKMCPLVKELKTRKDLNTIVCVTGQHREMLNQVLDCFDVVPNYNLDIMQEKQTLFDITINIIERIKDVLEKEQPDVILVHGDTSTTFVTSLCAFYKQIPIGHVEAGLRTYNIYSPYPEEFNRQATSIIAKYHFAPTEKSKNNLLKEITEASMYDSIDKTNYINTGTIKINSEKFIENFTRRFAESAPLSSTYEIRIYDISEYPPKVSLSVNSIVSGSVANEIVDFSINNLSKNIIILIL